MVFKMMISELLKIISSLLEELLNMEIYARPLVWKGIVKFDYITTAEEDEKYLTIEEISILLIYVNMIK